MKKAVLALPILLFLSSIFFACQPATGGGIPLWAKRLGGANDDRAYSVIADSIGNIIAVGKVSGQADLNGDGDTADGGESASGYGSDDIFIVKFNSAGVYQWSKRLGGTNHDCGYSAAVDSDDSVIVAGFIDGAADLNGDGDWTDANDGTGGLSGEISTGYLEYDIFVSKFDFAGVYQWSRRLGGTGVSGDFGRGVAADASGNVIVVGYAHGNADLNGDADSTDGGAETAGAAYGGTDIVISMFNSSGVHQWSKRLGGPNGDKGYGITADVNGNIIVTGLVNGSADLNGNGNSTDGGAESAAGYGGEDIFISRFDSSGTCQWNERLGGTDVGSGECGYSIKADTVGNIVIVGVVRGSADLNGDGDSLDGGGEAASSCYDYNDIFVAEFQEIEIDNNYIYMWSRRLGGTSSDYGYNISFDAFNNSVIISGAVSGNADLNGDADAADGGGESAAGYSGSDIFVTKFTSGGTHLWSERLGGTDAFGDSAYGTAVDLNRHIFIAGYVAGSADLNGDGDAADGTPESGAGYGGAADIFIVNYDSDGSAQ
ncbi:MAG: SBBP repeat-containing protein [Spirochaetales bacterium]|nr:SBBP repeat-containing protein [Spirochaetales bacterium]